MSNQCCPQNSSLPTWHSCPWGDSEVIRTHRLQFHFEHDPRFALFHHIAKSTTGHNAIAYLLEYHESLLSREWFVMQFDEALLYTVAHLLFLSLVEATETAKGKSTVALSGEREPEQRDFAETGLLEAPGRATYSLSPFGIHLQSIIRSSGVTIGLIDVESQIRAANNGRNVDRSNGCCL